MFGSGILEVGIGVVFVFLVLSLLCKHPAEGTWQRRAIGGTRCLCCKAEATI
jgi:hypothetical protein